MLNAEDAAIIDILTREGVDIEWYEDSDHESLHWGDTHNLHIKVVLKKGGKISNSLYVCPGSLFLKDEINWSRILKELFNFASDLAGMSSFETWRGERGEDLIGVTMDSLSEEEKQKRYQEYYDVCEQSDRALHTIFGEDVFEELYEIIIG